MRPPPSWASLPSPSGCRSARMTSLTTSLARAARARRAPLGLMGSPASSTRTAPSSSRGKRRSTISPSCSNLGSARRARRGLSTSRRLTPSASATAGISASTSANIRISPCAHWGRGSLAQPARPILRARTSCWIPWARRTGMPLAPRSLTRRVRPTACGQRSRKRSRSLAPSRLTTTSRRSARGTALPQGRPPTRASPSACPGRQRPARSARRPSARLLSRPSVITPTTLSSSFNGRASMKSSGLRRCLRPSAVRIPPAST
mmetsp:Transcript_35660/g.112511  ORF Transcript_35660/g.112511 Transcript_35660/m.112511 type:complete len:262 (+) Transcript_35660:1192-1977(+)